MKPKEKYLKQTPIFTFYDPPADVLIINQDEWAHAVYVIKRTLQDFELHPTEAVEHYSFIGLPFLGWFKTSLNCRIKRQNTSFAPHEEFEPTLAALDALKALQDLFKDNGGINPEKAKIFLLSFQLLLGCLRSGIGLKKERHLHAPKQKKDERLLTIIRELEPQYTSAQHLLGHFPKRKVDGWKYRKAEGDGVSYILRISPAGEHQSFGLRALSNYWKDVKKKLER